MRGKKEIMSKRKLKYTNGNNISAGPRKQILLTISILVSGRREGIERCIASLERLRQRVSCELILTDTGCPPEMQEWMKERADKVLRFKWCDDFAAARNVGLQAARGQWFMFMDDDEWFEDTTRIENFFLTGDYKRYESASYIVRNYVNMEGTMWRDTYLTRMTRRRTETRFFYPIHESLWPLLEPEKRLEDYAHHYGYASEDPEVQMAKRKRNLGILLSAIKEDPHCMKHYLQAVSEYYAMDDWDSACRMADIGIANCDPARQENVLHIDGLYAAAVRMRLRGGRSMEVTKIGRDYLEHAPISDLAKASICSDLVIAYGELGEDALSWRYLQDYLKWKEYFESHREIWLKQETLVLDSCFENYQYRKAMGWGLAVSLSMGDIQGTEELLSRGELVWWMDAARHWYVMTNDNRRKKWQVDFRCLVGQITDEGHFGGLDRPAWQEDVFSYPHILQLYEVLTIREPETGKAETEESEIGKSEATELGTVKQETGVPETGKPGAGEPGRTENTDHEMTAVSSEEGTGPSQGQKDEVAQEIQSLAVQLKEKVRELIRQGQKSAALGVITQLQGFFPNDPELVELQRQCTTFSDEKV